MFRIATRRELICVMEGLGIVPPLSADWSDWRPSAAVPSPLQHGRISEQGESGAKPNNAQFRAMVIELIQAELTERCLRSVVDDMKNPRTRADIAIETMVPFSCKCIEEALPPTADTRTSGAPYTHTPKPIFNSSTSSTPKAATTTSTPTTLSTKTSKANLLEATKSTSPSAWKAVASPYSELPLCSECMRRAHEFAKAIFLIFERDFMQLVLGHLGNIISSRIGVQFILTGIVLSQFYLRLPPSNNMIGMTTRALITMSNPEVWQSALRLYGPAPRSINRFGRLRNHTVAMRPTKMLRTPKLSESGSSTALKNADTCSECKAPLFGSEMVSVCECGSVVIRYLEYSEFDTYSSLSHDHLEIESTMSPSETAGVDSVPFSKEPRPRAFSQ
eukprot:m.97309 g.97309  ORF g.97309 m.97309 type:complete len:390 (-) comp51354_c0_seq2:1613-2782(-)